jgi:hypothetical protein
LGSRKLLPGIIPLARKVKGREKALINRDLNKKSLLFQNTIQNMNTGRLKVLTKHQPGSGYLRGYSISSYVDPYVAGQKY